MLSRLYRWRDLLERLLKRLPALIRAGLFRGFDEAGGLILYRIFSLGFGWHWLHQFSSSASASVNSLVE